MEPVNLRFPDSSIHTVLPTDGAQILQQLSSVATPESLPVALYINNALQGASDLIPCDGTVRGVPRNTVSGQHVVRRTLVHMFVAAAAAACPARHFTLRHTIGYAWYFVCDGAALTAAEVEAINTAMTALSATAAPITVRTLRTEVAIETFANHGDNATALLLRGKNEPVTRMVHVGEHSDLYTGPVTPTCDLAGPFTLAPYGTNGVLVHYCHETAPLTVAPWSDNGTLVRTHAEHALWAGRLGIETVGGLNQYIANGNQSIREVIQLCDLNQERYIARCADAVPEGARLVLIAGPSSSGKTTFARKLCVHLRCRGLVPQYMGCDDFYLEHKDCPRNPDGTYDFECVEALDLPLINDFLTKLVNGEKAEMPVFNFKTGKREWNGYNVSLPPNGVLVIEGIHGLNPKLTEAIAADQKFKIFISPVSSMQLSDHQRLSTADNRLIRRMVRDFKYRAHSAAHTLSMWPSVRMGEDLYIYKYQDNADAVMNSSLNYELAVLGHQAIPLLRGVAPSDPGYDEARRVLDLLTEFSTIDETLVPSGSILQEFLGVNYLFA